MNNKKGISLIVLVITILVMIILAGVVIVSLQDNNPIGKAKFAKTVDSIQSIRSSISQYAATAQAGVDVTTGATVTVESQMNTILNEDAIDTDPSNDPNKKIGTYDGWRSLKMEDEATKKALGVDPKSLKSYGTFWVNPSTGASVFKLADDTFKTEATGVDGIILKDVDMKTAGVAK